jgi:hypothetical protein
MHLLKCGSGYAGVHCSSDQGIPAYALPWAESALFFNRSRIFLYLKNSKVPAMSRLDSFIRRMIAQRECLNWAAEAVQNIDGPVLELGLGNGRTYDHLRELFPKREIYVFEREIRAHSMSIPPKKFQIIGDAEETLNAAADWLPTKAALAHTDLGTSDTKAYESIALHIGKPLKRLMANRGIIVSNMRLPLSGLKSVELPEGVNPGRYFIYRVS